MNKYIQQLGMVLLDAIIINIALIGALLLRFDLAIPENFLALYQSTWLILTMLQLAIMAGFRSYRRLWKYAGVIDLIQLALSILLSASATLIYGVYTDSLFPRTSYAIYGMLLLIGTLGIRVVYRLCAYGKDDWREYLIDLLPFLAQAAGSTNQIRTLIIGAGEAGVLVLKDLQYNRNSPREIVALVDDDTTKIGSYILGVRVAGDIPSIPALVAKYHVEEIIFAIPTASKSRTAKILGLCSSTGCKLKMFRGIDRTLDQKNKVAKVQDVSIEDLLGRDPIQLDQGPLATHVRDKVVLVTGGGGSIGSELCRQIASYSPCQLIIFDIYENNAYDIQNELLRNGFPKEKLLILIGSVRDKEKVDQVFHTYQPQLVFHAAAHKHVPLMEDSPAEAIKNNVFGTLNVALCAREYSAEKFVLISTDKAVNPTNVMGASKRICEMIVQSIDQTSARTEFVAVRFGNVLGSNGSVIPLFKRQLEAGGPLTVTHPEIIRYFMTIPEAVSLVLQAMTYGQGGEIFVLDMGEPVKILDLATNFIKLSGLKPNVDIEIQFTGLRPGEKLYEELLMTEEGLNQTACEKIFIAQPMDLSFYILQHKLNLLHASIADSEALRLSIQELVPTYTYQKGTSAVS